MRQAGAALAPRALPQAHCKAPSVSPGAKWRVWPPKPGFFPFGRLRAGMTDCNKTLQSSCCFRRRDGGYLRSSFLGRTTHRVNSPRKAAAAARAIIGTFLRTRYAPSIAPGCYAAFTWVLNVCYFQDCPLAPASGKPPGKEKPRAPVRRGTKGEAHGRGRKGRSISS